MCALVTWQRNCDVLMQDTHTGGHLLHSWGNVWVSRQQGRVPRCLSTRFSVTVLVDKFALWATPCGFISINQNIDLENPANEFTTRPSAPQTTSSITPGFATINRGKQGLLKELVVISRKILCRCRNDVRRVSHETEVTPQIKETFWGFIHKITKTTHTSTKLS